MKMLTVSALLCAMLVLTRATSPAEGEDDPGTEEPTESTPAPSAPAEGEDDPETEEPTESTPAPSAPAEGENDPETEEPAESTPAPSAPAEGENDPETEKPAESTPAPSEEEPGTEEPVVVTAPPATFPPTTLPPIIYDDFGFHEFGFSCPDGWTMFDTRCLLYVPETMTWADAEQNCQSGNGDYNAYGNLASVFEEYYFDEIQEVMQKAGHKSGQVWLGGFKAPEDSSRSWSDDMSPRTFPNWCSGEPSKENCLKSNFEEDASGCLEGSPCDAELPSVCSIILM